MLSKGYAAFLTRIEKAAALDTRPAVHAHDRGTLQRCNDLGFITHTPGRMLLSDKGRKALDDYREFERKHKGSGPRPLPAIVDNLASINRTRKPVVVDRRVIRNDKGGACG